MLHSAMLWLFCALCIHICAAISLFVRALKSIFICLRLHWNVRCTYLCSHTHTNINGCCLLKGFVVCHLVRIAIRFLSISFRSITIPFDLVDITNLLLTGHIIFLAAALCCNNFTIPHTIFTFYTSKARIWFVALRSVLCCFYLSFSCYSFDLDCRVELSVCTVHCSHRSLYIPRLSSCIWVRVFMFVRSFQQLNRKCVPSGSSTAYFIQHNTRDVL